MQITADEAYPVFLEVKRVKETLNRYCQAPDKVPVSLDDIEFAIKEEYGATIDKKTLPFKSDLVRGLIRIWDSTDGAKLFAQTVIDSELNLAHTRHVQTKELCHIIIHHAENCTNDPTQIIEYFVQDSLLVTNGDRDYADVKNEALADLAAFELLFPHELRSAAKERVTNGTDSVFSVADWLELPEHVVEYVLTDRYLVFAGHIWDKLSSR